jgi:hypothetical protein
MKYRRPERGPGPSSVSRSRGAFTAAAETHGSPQTPLPASGRRDCHDSPAERRRCRIDCLDDAHAEGSCVDVQMPQNPGASLFTPEICTPVRTFCAKHDHSLRRAISSQLTPSVYEGGRRQRCRRVEGKGPDGLLKKHRFFSSRREGGERKVQAVKALVVQGDHQATHQLDTKKGGRTKAVTPIAWNVSHADST